MQRDGRYAHFRFLLDLGDGNDGPDGGFAEVSGFGMDRISVDYRNTRHNPDRVAKVPELNKHSELTLKRGIIDSLKLCRWLEQIRNGGVGAQRDVTIQMRLEDASVLKWKLTGAYIVKRTSPPLDANDNELAMEELVLAYDGVELDC